MPSKLLLMVISSVLSVLALTCPALPIKNLIKERRDKTEQFSSSRASADSVSIAKGDTLKVLNRGEQQLTACLPGAWIVHGSNGPLFVRESSLQRETLEREKKAKPLRCW